MEILKMTPFCGGECSECGIVAFQIHGAGWTPTEGDVLRDPEGGVTHPIPVEDLGGA